MADPGRMIALQEELLSRRISEWYDKVFSPDYVNHTLDYMAENS